MDPNQLHAIQTAVEQACLDFQNPATQAQAEKVLLHFRQQHRPALPACRHILTHSASADARFQAALALREALLREWAGLSQAERDGLQAWLFHEVLRLASTSGQAEGGVQGSTKTGHAAQSSLCAALAVAVKRGWMDKPHPERGALLQEVVRVVSSCGAGAGGVPAACAGLNVLEAIVSEFSLATASPLGLAWDYHAKCAQDFEEHHLHGLFTTASQLARQAASSGASLRGEDGGVTAAAASLMTTCLQWEFKKGMHASLSMPRARQQAASHDPTSQALNPGQSWTELLLSPETTTWLTSLLAQFKASYGPLSSSTLRHASSAGHPLHALAPGTRSAVVSTALKCRALLAALCSLTGDVFPRNEGGGAAVRHRFLVSVLQGVLPGVWPVNGALAAAAAHGYEGSELLDAVRCLCVLAPVHRGAALQAAGSEVLAGQGGSPAGGFLGVMEQLTLALVRLGGVNASGVSCADEGDDKYWQQECIDMLLEAWCAVLTTDCLAACRPDGSHLPHGTLPAAAAVFTGLVDAALQDAARGATEEVEDAAEAAEAVSLDDWMARAVVLARAAPNHTFPHVAHALGSAQHALASCASTGGDPSVPLEQLSWLVRMCGHCLADSGAGETPLLPLALLQAIEGGVPGVCEVVCQLCSSLLNLVAVVLQPQARPLMSPRLMEASVWSLARWADTYLLPDEHLPGALHELYGSPTGNSSSQGQGSGHSGSPGPGGSQGSSGGVAVLDMAVQVANTCLTSFPGEAELHKQVVCVLLPALVRRKRVCEQLVKLPAWHALAEAVAGRAAVLQQGLGQKLHRHLAQCLVMSALGFPRTSAASQYISHLLASTVQELGALASRPDLSVVACRADVVAAAGCLIETLRGAHCGALSRTQTAVWSTAAAPLLGPLLQLSAAFKAHSQTVALILKLAADLVESHVSYLQATDVAVLLRWVLALLQQYAADNTWAVRLAATRTQQEAIAVEAARDLRALLRLLGHVTQRDLVGAAGGGHASSGGLHGNGNGIMANGVSAATAANSSRQQDMNGTEGAQVVLAGLHILLPLMSPQLLLFPKLPRLYFNLLAYCMESWPEQVAQLSPAAFSQLMASLEWALSPAPSDATVTQSALEGLAGLARYQASCQAAGQPGLAVHHAAGGRSVTQHFMELLLRRLLLGEWNADLVELAADPLQPLLELEPAAYAAAAQQLVAAATQQQQQQGTGCDGSTQGSAANAAGQKVMTALASLVYHADPHHQHAQHGDMGRPASRPQKRVFRQMLCQVVADVRSLVCVK